ncbi:MAG: phage tail sheath subtilisin-like domain-containing protein [Bacteroidales bacterium]|nr:phage tail sheath subtilisin-like domain-containing protein [Bacteroidales bacterium]
MAYKTPGVYIKEISLFPPSVAQVETAIPAFIGYTEKARDDDGKDVTNLPVRIKSLVEFQACFGGEYIPTSYKVIADSTRNNALVSVTPEKRFWLYDSMRQFFDNGGGDCYIVSVGSFTGSIGFAELNAGFEVIKKVDEPTLLIAPDALGLKDGGGNPDITNFSNLQVTMLKQCASLQDRFSILDILKGYLAEDAMNSPVSEFRDNIGIQNLSYGAAYYPWIIASYNYDVSFRQLKIFDLADTNTEITDYSSYANDSDELDLISALKATQVDTDAATEITDPTVDAMKLRAEGTDLIREMLIGYESLVASGSAYKSNFTNYLNLLAGIARCFKKAENVAQAGSVFLSDIELLKVNSDLNQALEFLVSIEKNTDVQANTLATRTPAIVEGLYAFVEPDWFGNKTFASIPAEGNTYENSNAGAAAIINVLRNSTDVILSKYQQLLGSALFSENHAESAVFSEHEFFHGVRDKVLEHMRTLPPSGAIAGIYATVDNTRGVWKAPANISLSSVIGPAVRISNKEQESLNVHTSGKSVNAIRAFIGNGTLVWGARTLAGNDNEWRYIPVRRFFIMVEESVKKATEPFTFEPNNKGTWVKIRSMIENFLTLQWRTGALFGAKPEDAFYVNVGLGETMTEQDILEGRMIVEIGMAAVRPAEFIILRFSHKMNDK